MKDKIIKFMSHEILQKSVLMFFTLAGGVIIGIADIIQNYGSRYNPPNFWQGVSYKLIALPIFLLCLFYLSKDYKPHIFKENG